MDAKRFDHLARTMGRRSSRRRALTVLTMGLGSLFGDLSAMANGRRCRDDSPIGQCCKKRNGVVSCTCDDGGTVCGPNCCAPGQACRAGECAAPPRPGCIPFGAPCKGVGRRCCDSLACASGQGGQTDVACYVPAGGPCETTADCVFGAECRGGRCVQIQPPPPPPARWTPERLKPSLLMWLDASDHASLPQSSGPVAVWNDLSGNARNVTQATPANQPTAQGAARNGNTVVRFNGSAKTWLDSASTGLSGQPFSYALTFKASAAGYQRVFQGLFNSGNFEVFAGGAYQTYAGAVIAGGTSDQEWHLAVLTFSGASSAIVVDGAVVASGNVGATHPAGTFTVGCDAGGARNDPFTGDIGEVLVLDVVPGIEERQRIEGYLAHTWGLADNLPDDHPYKVAAPVVR